MYKTAVYTLVNGVITHKKQQISSIFWFWLAKCHYCQTVWEVYVHKCYIYCFL